MNVIGNVLGSSRAMDPATAPVSTTYVSTGSGSPAIYEIGAGVTNIAWTSLWWHGNHDTVTPGIV
jgi:hypothetical protein